jgi:hypothetical protein
MCLFQGSAGELETINQETIINNQETRNKKQEI